MKPKILSLHVGDFAPSTRTITPQGFLLCAAAKLAKAPQVRPYMVAELGALEGHAPDQTIQVFTAAEVLFSPKAIKSFFGVDVADYHPAGNEMNVSTWRQHVVGVLNNVRQEGDWLLGDLLIKDSAMIGMVQRNERVELSLGYACDVVLESGVSPDGMAYQAKMINVVGDHVALVEYGRCGGACRIADQKTVQKHQPVESVKMARLVVDGLPFDVAGDHPALEAALKNQADKLAALQSAKISIGDQSFGMAELPAVQAVVTKLVADGKAYADKIALLEANQVTPEKLEALAAQRAAVIADAKKLHPQVKTDGCSCEQIKRDAVNVKAGDALVQAVLNGVAVADAKPEQIDTVFRALSAVVPTVASNLLSTALQGGHSTGFVGDGLLASAATPVYDKSRAYMNLK